MEVQPEAAAFIQWSVCANIMSVNLSGYDNAGFSPGASMIKRAVWYVINAFLFNSWLWPGSSLKCAILRMFGATVGRGVVIKPRVNIKYPWRLELGDHVWIGEDVWIDNLAPVYIASNVCVSQGAYLLTGNHNYKDPYFGLVLGEINIKSGVWVGARAVVCPGVHMDVNTVLTAGSVLQRNSKQNGIYQGNPAEWVRERRFNP